MKNNRLPAALDRLRRRRGGMDQGDVTEALRALNDHLEGLIGRRVTPDDIEKTCEVIENVFNATGAGCGEGEGDDEGEPMGERLTPAGEAPTVGGRHGFDYSAPRGMGMDRAPVVERRDRRTPAGMTALFDEFDAPRRAEAVR